MFWGRTVGVFEGRGLRPGVVGQAFLFNGTDADVRVPPRPASMLGALAG